MWLRKLAPKSKSKLTRAESSTVPPLSIRVHHHLHPPRICIQNPVLVSFFFSFLYLYLLFCPYSHPHPIRVRTQHICTQHVRTQQSARNTSALKTSACNTSARNTSARNTSAHNTSARKTSARSEFVFFFLFPLRSSASACQHVGRNHIHTLASTIKSVRRNSFSMLFFLFSLSHSFFFLYSHPFFTSHPPLHAPAPASQHVCTRASAHLWSPPAG